MKEIAEQDYQIPLVPRNGINCYLVEDTLVDAGIRSSFMKIRKSLRNWKVFRHLLTHAHPDHQGSSRAICEAFEIPLWTSVREKKNAESGKVTVNYPGQQNVITRFQQKFWSGLGAPVSHTVEEGDRIGNFTVIATPGHSPGHISLFRPEDHVLIVGDTLVHMNLLTTIPGLHEPPDMFTTDKSQNRKSIRKLAELNPKILAFGHGPVLRNEGQLQRWIERELG
mgnify:CR=1 FL=1